MEEELIRQLSGFCSVAEENLSNLRDQLNKIIVVKKKLAADAASSVMLSQAADVAKTTENFEKINAKLPEAINSVNELSQKVQLLSTTQLVASPRLELRVPNVGSAPTGDRDKK